MIETDLLLYLRLTNGKVFFTLETKSSVPAPKFTKSNENVRTIKKWCTYVINNKMYVNVLKCTKCTKMYEKVR